MPSFGTLGQLFKIPALSAQIYQTEFEEISGKASGRERRVLIVHVGHCTSTDCTPSQFFVVHFAIVGRKRGVF